MGTTPTYGLPYPELTDAANVPVDMKELAEATEAAMATVAAPRMTRYKSTSQTLTSAGTQYLLTYDTEDAVGGPTSGGVTYSAGVFTLPRAGVYQFNVGQHFQAASGSASLYLYVNAVVIALISVPTPTNSSMIVSRSYRAAAGDAFKVQGQHSIASAVAYGAAVRYSFVDISLVAP